MNNHPQTFDQVKNHFESNGFKTIPIKFDGLSKKPHPSFTHEKLESRSYHYSTDGIDGIAMVHGSISGTFAIDIDFKEKSPSTYDAITVLFNDPEKTCQKTLVIKTPKQGVHFIFKCADGIFPPQKKYTSKKYPGVEIDIRSTHGYTLIPPSNHPEKQYGKYSFISETLTPATMKWDDVLKVLSDRGFFSGDEITSFNDYDIENLMAGKFERGSRRRSENSLYCKLRIRGFSEEKATAKIIKINTGLAEPLSSEEVQRNVAYAESFFMHHILPDLKKNQKKHKFKHYEMSSQLLKQYDFISHVSGEIYYYTDGIYRKNGEKLIRKKCRQFWESIGIRTTDIFEITNIIRDKTTVFGTDENDDIFDLDFTKIVLKNGVYDIANSAFLPHSKELKCTIKHPIFYDDSKKCPKFDAFLESCFDGDAKKISNVLDMMALCFIKNTIIQKGFINYGIGSNGKTTLMKILINMLGHQNVSATPMQDFQNNQFSGFDIRGKVANISSDGGTEPVMKTGMIKSVLGDDYLRCEEKRKSAFMFKPFCTLIFTFNELPHVNDSSDGFARKIQTIYWHKKFHGAMKDPVVENIAFDSDERSGIFNKLIPVIDRLLKTRKIQYEDSVDQTKEIWMSRSDSFFRFKKDHIVLNPNHSISTQKLIEIYEKFCEENGMTPLRERQFFKKVSSLLGGIKPTVTRRDDISIRVWYGLTVDSELRHVNQKSL